LKTGSLILLPSVEFPKINQFFNRLINLNLLSILKNIIKSRFYLMLKLNKDTRHFIETVGNYTSEFLLNETRIETLKIDYQFNDIPRLKLNYLTSIMAVEGQFQVMFAFSFERELASKVTEEYVSDLGIGKEELGEYIDETAADIINIILGNTLVYFQISGKAIELTPPIVITEAKTIYRTKPAQFLTAKLCTKFGDLDICCIGPKDLFDLELNYLKKINQ